MIKVGDKVVVTKIIEDILEGIELYKVGEVVEVDYYDSRMPYLVKFGDCNYWSGLEFIVEKFDDKEEREAMLEVGDKVVVTEIVKDVLEGVELYKVGEIVAVNYSHYTNTPYLVDFGDCKWWAGSDFIVEKVELVEEKESMLKVGQGFALEETETYIEEKQDTKEIDNPPLEGAYNTVIKKDGLTVYTNSTVIEKDGLTIYTNYSVEAVGEVMRVGGVDDLVVDFDDSEEG